MLKLYGGARSRASIVQWYLEELALPYEFVMLDMAVGEHLQPAYRAINPAGKVPALVDQDLKLWESGAILLYLSEKYGPAITVEQRALMAQWVLFANATLGPGLMSEASRAKEMDRLLAAIATALETQPFLLGESLSAADVAVGAMLAYMTILIKLSYDGYPAIEAYLERLTSRPAFQKSIGARSTASH